MNNQCGTRPTIGFRFTLSPMTSDFVSIIKGALRETDLQNVKRHTDDVSTIIRGRSEHVFDVAKSVLAHATRTGVHVSMSGTFSVGCPGESEEGDLQVGSSRPLNGKVNPQYVSSQFAIYPLGQDDYMDIIHEEIDFVKERGVFNDAMIGASGIHGDIEPVFGFYEATFNRVREQASHVVMTVTFSVNSPSHRNLR